MMQRQILAGENCRLCGQSLADHLYSAQTKWGRIYLYKCSKCFYVQTQRPTWLLDAYAEPINISDTGIMTRNASNLDIVIATLAFLGILNERVVDFAGGYGILVRMLRDKGIDAYWNDPFATNLLSKGFEFSGGYAGLVTAFEAFEHFANPLEEAKKMANIAPNILFSTLLIPDPVPPLDKWWYYGLEHGQHIGFFSINSLEYLAKSLGLFLTTDGDSLHLLTKKKISFSKWQMYRKIHKFKPSVFTRGLMSKTWSDHLTFVQ